MEESTLLMGEVLAEMKLKDPQKVDGRSGSPTGDSRIRRASYYVWFLGAEECKGLRGSEVVRPVLQYLLEREREHEPEKVTLQVSGRGIKLLQQGVTSHAAAAGSTKHFIPCGALTHVQQEEPPDDDIVSVVLLIYNPMTRCPVHLHGYRCDSTETAVVLRQHLHQLLLRPEQQAKLTALESRLVSRGLLPSSSRASDAASSGSSVSSGAGSGSGRAASGEKIATLYDSLAAELREKLGTRGGPILLPPKDYDRTGRRRKKPLSLDARGGSSDTRKMVEVDSPRSSGIGSDDTPSPTQDRDFEALENQSSSDNEWVGHESAEVGSDAGLLLVQPSWRSHENVQPRQTSSQRDHGQKHHSPMRQIISHHSNLSPIRILPTRKQSRRKKDRSSSPTPKNRFQDAREKFLSLERQRSAIEVSSGAMMPHPDGLGRCSSWEVTPKAYPHQGHRGKDMRRCFGSKEDILSPKSDRDNGYGTRDVLSRERRSRDSCRDLWNVKSSKRDGCKFGRTERTNSPIGSRVRTPVREHRVPRVRSPERQEYLRAKSMHDLSHRRLGMGEEEQKGRDLRRRSLYDPSEDSFPEGRKAFISPGSSCSSSPSRAGVVYHELPEHQRHPGLDRDTACMDPLDPRFCSKKTFDYPVNGGHAPIHITRAHHDDYRKFRYDHGNSQFIRGSTTPTPHY